MGAQKLIVFSAPSGSGKTTLVRHLLQLDLPLGFSISATSRPPRGNEVDGKDYYFLSSEAFRKKIKANAFIEYEEVYTNVYYGTLESEIERLWDAGKTVLFDIDVVGGLNVKRKFPEATLAIFVQPPSLEALADRLRGRGTDPEEKIKERLAKATQELTYANGFDSVVINDDLDTAKKEVEELVRQHIVS